MLRSQVITLNVVYEDLGGVRHPEYWSWDTLILQGTYGKASGLAVEVIAAGECKRIPRDKEDH